MSVAKIAGKIKDSLKGLKKNKSNYKYIAIVCLLAVVAFAIYSFFAPNYGPSHVRKSSVKIIQDAKEPEVKTEDVVSHAEVKHENEFKGEKEEVRTRPETVRNSDNQNRVRKGRNFIMKYRAKQVIVRSDLLGNDIGLSVGTNLIGSMLMSVDTRANDSSVRVILPYGSSQSDEVTIPRNTTLLGNYQYQSGSKRLTIRFNRCVFPDGREYQIEAQVLDSSDYKSGVEGDYHSNSTTRIATTLGLSMVAGMAEVFTEKVVLGDGYSVTPKATLENALSQGTAKAANYELERQIQGMGSNSNEYLTIQSGKEVIVSLTKSFRGEAVAKK